MEIEQVKRREKKATVNVTLKISIEASKWMKEKNVSPNAVLNRALKELMEKE